MEILDLLIQNATCLVWKNNKIHQISTNVGVKNKKISWIQDTSPEAKQVLDAKGLHLLPGVIDSQVHFREPGMTQKEDIDTGTKSAVLGGITSIFEMPNTNPPTISKEQLEFKLNAAKNRAWTNYAFYVGATPNNIEELKSLENLPGCCGIKVFMGSSTGTLLIDDDKILEKIFQSGHRRIAIHSEDEVRLKERKHLVIDSKDVRLHPVWRDEETALRSTKKLLGLAKKTNRPVHILHVSTAEEMALLKTEKISPLISVEVLPNHLTFMAPECYEKLGTLAQQNPPIREKRHQEALWKALNEGLIDILGSDHAPHTLEEKSRDYPESPSGTPGVQTLVPIMLNHIHNGKLSLEKFVELVCENPRFVFGCLNKGRIEVGLDADFTLVDLKQQRVLENKWIVSRCGWTPFNGMKITGWPKFTIIGGSIVVAEDKFLTPPLGQQINFSQI